MSSTKALVVRAWPLNTCMLRPRFIGRCRTAAMSPLPRSVTLLSISLALWAGVAAATPLQRVNLQGIPLMQLGIPLRNDSFQDLVRPLDIDPVFDCGVKQAAWDYARMLLPERGPLVQVFDAFQLGIAPCNGTRPSATDARLVRAQVASAAKAYYADSHRNAGPTLFVDPENGRDAMGGGSENAPFKSIAYAVAQSRALRATLADGVTVQILLRGGLYQIAREIALGPEDSLLDIGAFGDEEPVLSAGCPLRALSWAPVAHPPAQLPKGGVVYVANVTASGCGQFDTLFVNGRRAVRARYPNANPETMGLHTNTTGYIMRTAAWLPPRPSPPATEVRIDTPTRPGYFPSYTVGIGGPVSQYDPPVNFFANVYAITSGVQYFPEDLPNRTYAHPETGIVHVFHYAHWGGWQFRIDTHDEANHTFTWSYGGFQEARGAAEGGAEFYLENLFEELDSPGEWYLNHTTNELYYYPNASDFASAVFTASGVETIFRIGGSMKEPVRNVSIHGLTFTQTAPTFLRPYEAPSGGDWSVHRGATVFVEGGEHVVIAGNTFNATGGNAVFLSNYNRGAVVARNEFFLLGDSAIVSVGSVRLNDGTDGNQPRGNLIEGNLAHDLGVYGKQVCGYVQSLSCQARIRNNVFFNGPRAGINLNDGFGGGNSVEGNLVFNMVRETSDHGPLNTWDRVPYLHDLHGDGVASLVPVMNKVTSNFFFNNYYANWPIDHDDGSAYYYDTGNVLVYGGYKSFLGHHHTVTNNLYLFADARFYGKLNACPMCIISVLGQPGVSNYGNVWTNNICVLQYDWTPPYYLLPCDENDTGGVIPFTAYNVFYNPAGDLPHLVYCGDVWWNIARAQLHGYDTGSTARTTPPSKDLVQMARDFLKIKS